MYHVDMDKTPVLVFTRDHNLMEWDNLDALFSFWDSKMDDYLQWQHVKEILETLQRNGNAYCSALYYGHCHIVIKPPEAF